jgi:serralysin
MTTYAFSLLTHEQQVAFNPSSDVLNFDLVGIDPVDLTLTSIPSGLSFTTTGGKTITLTGMGLGEITSANITFSGGGVLLAGDNNVLADDDLANTLTGGAGNDWLIGLGGNDTLDGGLGNDLLAGGDGDDTYLLDSTSDVVMEENSAGGGVDTAFAIISATLNANVENLVLTGVADIKGTGNALNNTLTGNAGDNILNGMAGNDTMTGGNGNDIYSVDSIGDVIVETNTSLGQVDTVQAAISYTLGDNLEKLELLPGAAAINGTGNSQQNTIIGNSGNNLLDGMAGADTMQGGDGNDTYVVDNSGDMVKETNNAPTQIDTVRSTVNFLLGDNCEILQLVGMADLQGTGNDLDNVIHANSGNTLLNGGNGVDTVSYEFGVMGGGDFGVTVSLATVGAQDTGASSIDTLLGFENLTGSLSDDELIGSAAGNILNGLAGADLMVGGNGNDTYVVDNSGDVVMETSAQSTQIDTVQSSIDYRLGASCENLVLLGSALKGIGNSLRNTMTGNAANNLLDGRGGADRLIGGDGNDTYMVDHVGDKVVESNTALSQMDTVKSRISYTLGTNCENLQLLGTANSNGKGNGLDNTVYANIGNNALDGAGGTDTLSYLFGAKAGVTVDLSLSAAQSTGGSGDDTLANFENLTGSTFDDTLSGTSGNNILDGGAGTDTCSYVHSATAGVTVNLGLSGVQHTVGSGDDTLFNFENLLGSDYADTLTGNSGNNVLTGNGGHDTIDGGAGADTMIGGSGNDTYTVDHAGDTVVEQKSAGNDLVQSSVAYTLSANVERLQLLGALAINGTGNALNNTLSGNSGVNVLDGGAGADTMDGGTGNDTYIVDSVNDVVTESTTASTNDTVQASCTHSLGENIEHLILTGSLAIDGTGNALNNRLFANAADNVLDGGDGEDGLWYALGATSGVTVDLNLTTAQDTGGSGIDTILNIEKLIGSQFADHFTGTAGDNNLDGWSGQDTLTGGAGLDQFRFTAAADSTNAAPDTITDFSHEQGDLMVLSSIYADTLAFLGSETFSGQAGELRYSVADGNCLVTVDLNGDSSADFSITLLGVTTLVAGDFVL